MPKSSLATPLLSSPRPRMYTLAIVAVALVAVGFLLVSRYLQVESARDQREWQDKLNLIAESRAAAVSEWAGGHFRELKKLAQNPSLQLYLTELSAMESGKGRTESEPAQKTYLRNLLIFTADRMGFSPAQVPLSVQIPAEIDYEASTGLAVVGTGEGQPLLVSTPFLSGLEPSVMQRLKDLPASSSALIDLYRDAEGHVRLGFVEPVFGIQADPASSPPLARVVGIKSVDDSLFSLLQHPGTTEKTMEAVLVRRDGENLTYLSPLADQTTPMEKSIRADAKSLAEAAAAAEPGAFVRMGDYRSARVLATARSITGTPWVLVVKVDESEALHESRLRQRGVVLMSLLAIGLVVTVVVSVWVIAASKQSALASRHFRRVAEHAVAQEKLLKLVTDNQSERVSLLDAGQNYRFVNAAAAAAVEMTPTDMVAKHITNVVGAAAAQDIVENANEALRHRTPQTRVVRTNQHGEEKVFQRQFTPLESLPVADLPENTPGVLVVEQDVSDLVHERERRIRLHHQLIETLITLVDRRDPNAASHSVRVGRVAGEVAQAMGLSAGEVETAQVAGSLMNIGKILVPSQVLTKTTALTEDELRSVHDSIAASAGLLKDIHFDMPVVDTLRQAYERWDGAGPAGLKEEGILITARIIAVVNAFVSMISTRAYRSALTVDAAVRVLMEQSETAYDRRVVVALANYVDNQGGRALLEQLSVELDGRIDAAA